MWFTIIPKLMTITVWVLTFFSIRAGTQPGYLQDYAVVSINATDLRQYEPSPFYDVYNIYMSIVCAGDYANTSPSSPLTNFTCTAPSSYCKQTLTRYPIVGHLPYRIHSLNLPELEHLASTRANFL